MRKLSAPRPEILRDQHDSTPEHASPPRPARQLSATSTTTLRPRQRSATHTAALRDQHDNPPEHGNSPRTAARAIATRNAGQAPLPGQQLRDDDAPPSRST